MTKINYIFTYSISYRRYSKMSSHFMNCDGIFILEYVHYEIWNTLKNIMLMVDAASLQQQIVYESMHVV